MRRRVASLAALKMEELPRQYPQLSRENFQAVLHYAAEAAHSILVACGADSGSASGGL